MSSKLKLLLLKRFGCMKMPIKSSNQNTPKVIVNKTTKLPLKIKKVFPSQNNQKGSRRTMRRRKMRKSKSMKTNKAENNKI